MQGWHRYWGKSDKDGGFHLLPYHSLDVAAVGHVLLRMRPAWKAALARVAGASERGLAGSVVFFLALHDLGKFAEGFQGLRSDLVERLGRTSKGLANRPRHDAMGNLLWRELWSPKRARPDAVLALRGVDGAEVSSTRAAKRWYPWISAVTGHHGRPPELANHSLLGDHFSLSSPSGSWKDAAEFVGGVHSILRPDGLDLFCEAADIEEYHLARSSWWMAGFAILCDWVGSNRAWFQYEHRALALDDYWERALGLAEKAVASAGLAPRRVRSFGGFGQMFPHIDEPSPLQAAAAEIPLEAGPQLFLIEDLTGSGKTEAALTLAGRLFDAGLADGLYFALPTMATANAMHARVAAVLGELFEPEPAPELVLAHSGPRLEPGPDHRGDGTLEPPDDGGYDRGEESASQFARSWFADNRKKALLADAGVGTIDQALAGVLRSKHSSLRLLGLHQHVLIVDEVHACDHYMNGLLEGLLQVQAAHGGSAILLSATLPLAARERLVSAFHGGLGTGTGRGLGNSYPALIRAGASATEEKGLSARPSSVRRLPVEFLDSFESVASWCEDRARGGSCVAWIRNTVRDALVAYDLLVSRLGADRVQLFHARFPMGDRLGIEQDVVARFGKGAARADREGRIVVATQVLEQSLDVDFDEMVTDIAPIDRIIQRAGRLQRHNRGERAVAALHVFAPPWEESPSSSWPGNDFAGTLAVYARPSDLWLTQRVLRSEGGLDLPARARFLVESVFGEIVDRPTAFDDLRKELEADGADLQRRTMSRHNRIPYELGYTREGAEWRDEELVPTRLGDPSVVIRLVRLQEGELVPWSRSEEMTRPTRWQLGELSVRANQISSGGMKEEKLRKDLIALDAEPPTHVIPVAMEQAGESWMGEAEVVDPRGGQPASVEIVFTEGRGVDFRRAGRT